MSPALQLPLVLVALRRADGYSDVHAELVAADALNHESPWPHEVLRDEGAEVVIGLERTEDYEAVPAVELAREAINKGWPAWRLVAE